MDGRNTAGAVRLTAFDEKRIVTKRLQRGECPSCGTRLFRFGLLGKKIAINGTVTSDGSCFNCFLEASKDKVPMFLEIIHRTQPRSQHDDDENKTMISGLTHEVSMTASPIMDDNTPPLMNEDHKGDTSYGCDQNVQNQSLVQDYCVIGVQNRSALAHSTTGRRPIEFVPPPQLLQQMTLAAVQQHTQKDGLDSFLSIKWEPARFDALDEEMTASSPSGPSVSVDPELYYSPRAAANLVDAANTMTRAVGQPQDIHFCARYQSNGDMDVDGLSSELGNNTSIASKTYPEVFLGMDNHDTSNIKGQLRVLSAASPRNRTPRVAALKTISDMLLSQGRCGQLELGECNGLETISSVIWSDIGDNILQEAALTVLFALVASADIETLETVWIDDPAQSCIDAMLVTMQTLLDNETIQSIGCKIFGCLAQASSKCGAINDGSLSGALWTVLNAMEHHEHSMNVQEPGVRSLHAYCLSSVHGEANLRALFANSLTDGAHGATVIKNALKRSSSSPALCERLCKLYRCLPAIVDESDSLAHVESGLKGLLSVIARYRNDRASILLVESAVATVADFMAIKDISCSLDSRKILALAFDLLRHHPSSHAIQSEVLRLLANFCAGGGLNKEGANVADTGDLRAVYDAMLRFPSLQHDALGVLRLLAMSSEDVRDCLLEPMLYAKLMQLRPTLQTSSEAEASTCRLIASLADCDPAIILPVISDLMEYILSAISRHPDTEDFADAAAFALSKVVRHGIASSLYVPIIDFALDISSRYGSSGLIQTSCCHLISGALSQSDASSGVLYERHGRCLQSLVQVVQSHSSKDSVLDAACDAMYLLLSSSYEMKNILLSDSSGEAVSDLLHTRLECPQLLVKVMAILSSILDGLPDDGRLSDTIDDLVTAMRVHMKESCLLSTGISFLCRVVAMHPNQTDTVSRAASTVVEAMSTHQDQSDLLEAACQLLLAMSFDRCSRRVVLDSGADVVLVSLMQTSKFACVRLAARSAVNELGIS